MSTRAPAIGIDFGTSNSAAACVGPDGRARALLLEGPASALPTAIFFNSEDRSTHFGREAMGLYLASTEGRLMRSLKSILGSALMQEPTEVDNRLVSFEDIISLFLSEIGERACRQLGTRPGRVVLGRPIRFVDDDEKRDSQAEDSLRRAASNAGLGEVSFQYEPIAAAFDFERRVSRESLVLIVDIGGGTSDFTVVRLGPDRVDNPDRADDVLATTGVHIGGTDYDQRLSLACAMPQLGFRHHGPQGREVPSRTFFDLSTWHLINWLQTPKSIRQVQDLRGSYLDTRLHDRLMNVLVNREGHRIASEVEAAKIRSSGGDAEVAIDLSCAERGLQAVLTGAGLAEHLQALLGRVVDCARECVERAGLRPTALDAIYLTGGSSALQPFQQALREAFPGVELVEGDLFGGVAAGLAYAAAGTRIADPA
ncbi:Hsp70 family protein [Variovorax sp. J22P168]|uniref:Hsp70 family protein n=1 Tax=Variovorax jilinensis TaxID=3053513 RepID=UPI0025752A03|nr:Hsp70 family protein [Variovorax sp. J22P168]MDM0012662.1 Hsp70 family protein [Variovorax sp. J22P168]